MKTLSRLVVLVVLLATGPGCAHVSLAYNAITYGTSDAGEASNVVGGSEYAYVSLGEEGLGVVALASGELDRVIPPPAGTESVDDLALADGLLFLLDAREPGFLTVMSLADPAQPAPTGPAREVGVGPFSGVSANAGRVVVSGGNAPLTVHTYSPDGSLGPEVGEIDLGQGQPDVLISPDGK